MRRPVAALLGSALSFFAIAANAQAFPGWPLPSLPSLPTTTSAPAPQASDTSALATWLSNATAAASTNLGRSCPSVEVAPGVHLPICSDSLPTPPPGVVVPEVTFWPPAPPMTSVDLRARNMDGPIKSQEQTGVCWAFALTTVLETSLRRQGRVEVLSPLHVVAAGTWNDLFQAKPREAITVEAAWPYDAVKACKFETGADSCESAYRVRTNTWRSEPQLVMERERARSMGMIGVGTASAIRKDPVSGIAQSLALGRAVYAVVAIDSRAWGYSSARSGIIAEYDQADRGGHAVAIVGYRPFGVSRQFLLHNSWGTTWGDGGYVWMSEAGLRRHLLNAYVVDALTGPAPVATGPVPSAPRTACASGTTVDVATGQCAALCPSGAAPVFGRCWLG